MREMPEKPKEIKQITPYVWEIPITHKKGMLVPARIVASKKLLDAMDPGVFDQVTNVACLPGLQKHAYCMPDGHWGYGFPIGGVAAFDEKEGVISPGGIGFDINCVSGDTKILTKYGYYKKMKDFDRNFSNELVSCMDLSQNDKKHAKAAMFLKKKPNHGVLKITTLCGESLVLTEDHPVFNGKEMIKAGELKEDDQVVIHPFEGIEYEKPSSEIILDEYDIIRVAGNRTKLIRTLKERGLIPLRLNSDKLPILIKLLGFLTGDGWLGKYYNKKRKHDVWSMRVIGKPEDLEDVRSDINYLGYNVGYMKSKYYESRIDEIGGTERDIKGNSTQLHILSQSFSVLMKALGMPEGNKSRVGFRIPEWIKKSPLWLKRLYLAGIFGAELTIPYQRKGEYTGFTEPSFSQNKIISLEKKNEEFLLDISEMLSEFGVKINKIHKQEGVINKKGEETGKLAIRISANIDNLINLWSRVGYEYCKERKIRSMLAVAYLKKKRNLLNKTQALIEDAINLYNQGTPMRDICDLAESQGVNGKMIKAQILRRSKSVRAPTNFPKFEEFIREHEIGCSEFVRDRIESIEDIVYDDFVYDFTMNDQDHNFIANCIVSHNCGMRLVTTNMTYDQVKPKLKELVDTFFKTVPTGVGVKGFVKVNEAQFRDVMTDGVRWCSENGYGWDTDWKHSESQGRIDWADPDKVSDRAVKRGISQIGTLGSGNHYLEVQVAHGNNIFDEETAKAFGIHTPDQVVVMVHCGSRGFGHQIATDYLRVFDSAMKKYNITVKDRELSCAPFSSPEGQDYYKAMACAANMAFANRQVITHRIREGFEKVFGKTAEQMDMNLVWDCCHNIARREKHKIDGKQKTVIVHRKGATKSFGPGHEELPPEYKKYGSPIIIGGSMETGSYLLAGTKKAEEETFSSTAHGSGRTMSRTKARKLVHGDKLQKDMEKNGIYVRAVSMPGLAEEAGIAYKDVSEVISSVHEAGISRRLVKLIPCGNIKG
ncbi:MAG: RtcB family protein [Candidatus Aenigmatarchaeota archaeon]